MGTRRIGVVLASLALALGGVVSPPAAGAAFAADPTPAAPPVVSLPPAGSHVGAALRVTATPAADAFVWSLTARMADVAGYDRCGGSVMFGQKGVTASVDADLDACATGPQELRVDVVWFEEGRPLQSFTVTTPVVVDDVSAPRLLDRGTPAAVTLTSPGVRSDASFRVECQDQSPVTWSWTLTTAGGSVARQSRAGTPDLDGLTADACQLPPWVSFGFAGDDASGAELADGAYTLTLTATDAGGRDASMTFPVVVDTRTPGSLVTPASGSRLEGMVDLSARATPGVDLRTVTFAMTGCETSTAGPDGAGLWTAQIPSSRCSSETTGITTGFHWYDGWGNPHSYTTRTPVTVVDSVPPSINLPRSVRLGLAAPGVASTATVRASCADASPVTWAWTFVDAAGAVIASGRTPPETCADRGLATLRGTDATGGLLPNGAYELVVTATDLGGLSTTVTVPVTVRMDVPGTIASSAVGASTPGVADVAYTPDPTVGQPGEVTVGIGWETWNLWPQADGVWRGSLPVGTWVGPDGADLTWTVRWYDGEDRSYTDAFHVRLQPAPPQAPEVATVYRFWSPGYGNAHFFTMSAAEAGTIRSSDPHWLDEGAAFQAYPAAGTRCSVGVPVYRFWSPSFSSHFFTADEAEKDRVVASDTHWVYEGVAYCAPRPDEPGAIPLFRFWSPRFGKHFYTADPAEAHQLDVNDPAWDAEGIAYSVLPTAAAG